MYKIYTQYRLKVIHNSLKVIHSCLKAIQSLKKLYLLYNKIYKQYCLEVIHNFDAAKQSLSDCDSAYYK